MVKNIAFLINKSEITAGTRGASLGPEAIITEARNSGITLFSKYEIHKLGCINHYLDAPTPFEYAKRIDGVLELYKDIDREMTSILTSGTFPIILAGDHGSAGGTIAGIKNAFPGKRLGVVWIDAHADIHTPFTTPSGNIHGMPLATALGIDNRECQSNEVDEKTIAIWNELKALGGVSPKILPEDLVYVAVRSTEEEEDSIVAQLGINSISVHELREKGIERIASDIDRQMAQCDIIYISFDVDSMDPDLTSHGTGTPVRDGLKPEEATALLNALAQNPKTVCLEVVEVNPCLDEKINTMAKTALDIVESFVNTIKN